MSIRPVDLGVIVQRTTEVDRAHQAQTQKTTVAQQQFGLEMQSKLEKRETEVKGAPEAARLSVNPDAEREPRERSGSKKDHEGSGGEPEERPVPRRGDPGHLLDIKL